LGGFDDIFLWARINLTKALSDGENFVSDSRSIGVSKHPEYYTII
jgi:hypothetical protein